MAKSKDDKSNSPCDDLSFEASLARLEEIVRALEEGELDLTTALARFEEGVQHLRRCGKLLEGAERKIELLTGFDSAGNPIVAPFDDTQAPLEERADTRSRRRSAPPAAKTSDYGPSLFDE